MLRPALAVFASALGVLVLAAGCGSSDGDDGGEGDGAAPAPRTELTVTVWPEGRAGASQEATLTCDPEGGTHRDAAAACAALLAHPDALEPVPPESACTMIFGGPEEAEVTGTFEGEQIEATFSKQNGCELSRWEQLAPVFQLEGP